jgi:hypothetical protein
MNWLLDEDGLYVLMALQDTIKISNIYSNAYRLSVPKCAVLFLPRCACAQIVAVVLRGRQAENDDDRRLFSPKKV